MLDSAARKVQANAQRVAVLQTSIAAVAAIAFGILEGGWQAVSAVFGGLVCICSTFLLRRSILRSSEVAKEDPAGGMKILYFGAVVRFVFVLALLGLGLAIIKVDPVAALVGFGCAQLAYAIEMRSSAHPKKVKSKAR